MDWLAFACCGATLTVVGVLQALLTKRVKRIEDLSMYDPTTGLLSGRYMDTVALPDALRDYSVGAVLLVDLDDFGSYNRRGYREGGDEALRRAAEAVKESCRRSTDRGFRMHTAGDEFLVLMPGARRRDAHEVAQVLLTKLRDRGVPGSIGVFAWDGERNTRCNAGQALTIATRLMRVAKKQGGDSIALGNEEYVPYELQILSGWAEARCGSDAVPVLVLDEMTVAQR